MDATLEEAVIEFYREEIRRRYLIDNLRRFEEFNGISDDLLNDLREFFLASIYPPAPMRRQLDQALDNLRGLLRSPKQLRPLLRSALTSMLRLGAQAPAAVSAGVGTVEALREAGKLEQLMLQAARDLDVDATDRQATLQIIASVPEEGFVHLIHNLLDLFRALSNVKMLSATLRIMDRSMKVMDSRPDLYDEELRASLKLGLMVLRGGLDLFVRLQPEDFPRIIKGVEMVEMDWLKAVRAETSG